MKVISDAWNWAADKVQTVTGEKERRRLVEEFKKLFSDFKLLVCTKIDQINRKTKYYNCNIEKINTHRATVVYNNLIILNDFLKKFGNAKSIGEYVSESHKNYIKPKTFEEIEDYIDDIDWSKEEIFLNTLLRTPIGTVINTKQVNQQLLAETNQFKFKCEEIYRELDNKIFYSDLSNKVCKMYIDTVAFITKYIEQCIIPELNIIESFLQAEEISTYMIAQKDISTIKFNNDIRILENTKYEKHYNFLKNAFVFYILSCKIYDTPVLTHLLEDSVTDEDVELLTNYDININKSIEYLNKNLLIQ